MSAPGRWALNATGRWDLFCRVVDNYGDIGIAWRLARQLADGAAGVRLLVDDLASFARIERRIDTTAVRQVVAGVVVERWPVDAVPYDVPDVVVELLGCGLPPAVVDAMSIRAPVWVDFEYLSAETWVDGFHGLPSPHPTLPLVKHFFYPGFGERTGGLLIEPGLDPRRRAFVDDGGAVASFRRRLGIPPDARLASLFAYPSAPLPSLLEAMADDARWTIVVPEGVLTEALGTWRASGRPSPAIVTIPFVDQDDYDRLLWTCDANFVRGEDSFVRAQAAGRPFVWHIYPQADDVHRRKLAAFEDLHEVGVAAATARAERRFWDAWNDPQADARDAARGWLAALPDLAEAAERWRVQVLAAPPLVDRLRAFVAARVAR